MGKGLGSGLGALFGDDVMGEMDSEMYVPLEKLEPRSDQPRTDFDEDALQELADSIREHGMIQPIVVRKLDGGYYQIIAGERRWRAARIAGLAEAPVRVLDVGNQETAELALIENLQRENLNPIEEARGYRTLMDTYGLTQEMVSERVGKSRPVVANSLRLLNLQEDVVKLVETGKISQSHARAIMELTEPEKQRQLALEVVNKDLSVRSTTAQAKKMTKNADKQKPPAGRLAEDGVDYITEAEKELTYALGRRVRITGGAVKGKFEIEYFGREDFEVMYRLLCALKDIEVEVNTNEA